MEILWAEPCQDLNFVRGTRVAVVVCVGSNQSLFPVTISPPLTASVLPRRLSLIRSQRTPTGDDVYLDSVS